MIELSLFSSMVETRGARNLLSKSDGLEERVWGAAALVSITLAALSRNSSVSQRNLVVQTLL